VRTGGAVVNRRIRNNYLRAELRRDRQQQRDARELVSPAPANDVEDAIAVPTSPTRDGAL
jgi:hypothetical protein